MPSPWGSACTSCRAALGLPKVPIRPPAPLTADEHPDAYLFTGCVMDAWQRDVHRAALRVMRATGAHVGLGEAGGDCCGALHTHAGRRADAERLAQRVIDAFPGDAPVVVDSAGCGAALADYGHLLGTDAARAFAARVVDVSTWLAGRPLPPLRRRDVTVVVQDPCHLRHVQHAHLPVAALLGARLRRARHRRRRALLRCRRCLLRVRARAVGRRA